MTKLISGLAAFGLAFVLGSTASAQSLGPTLQKIKDSGTITIGNRDSSVPFSYLDGNQKPIDVTKVDVSMNGIELQDREFFAAIKEKREPNASLAEVLPAMRTLDRLEKSLDS